MAGRMTLAGLRVLPQVAQADYLAGVAYHTGPAAQEDSQVHRTEKECYSRLACLLSLVP